MNPWDFTLYRSDDGSLVMRVVFSEGDYKIDISRYFLIDQALDIGSGDVALLKNLAAGIRDNYPDVALPLLDSAHLQILKWRS